jgi:cyclophilin family peptidyl-prolyl cis-trans isomerase
MDGQNVVFGRVIDGFRTFKLIERMDSVNEKPHPPVLIESAGLFVVPE